MGRIKTPPVTDRESLVRKARARRLAEAAALPPGAHDFADKLRLCMRLRGVNQSSLERLTTQLAEQGVVPQKVHQTRISKWLLRSGEPNHEQTYALARALRVPFGYLASPRRTEAPRLTAIEQELELEQLIARLGVGAALDRLLLRETVEVVAVTPVGPGSATAGEPGQKHRLRRG